MSVGSILKRKRKECGFTLLEVAKRVGVSEATMQRYECGAIKQIKYETVVKLAEIFRCDPQDLVFPGREPDEAEDERTIVDIYRTLTPDQKIVIKQMMISIRRQMERDSEKE